MSRSSGPDGNPSGRHAPGGPSRSTGDRSRPDRGQVEPLVALAALAVVGIALSAYALTLAGVVPPGGDRDRAGPTLGRVTDELAVDSVVDPGTLESGLAAAPPGYEVRITLTAGDLTWTAGPPAPPGADAAARPISVRLGPAEVWPGRLRVEVWT